MKAGALKPAHAVILRGLEIANIAHARAVTIIEIVEALTHDEVNIVKAAYRFALPTAIGSVMELLIVRGLVFSPGKRGVQRYFASANVLNRETTPLPEIYPHRYRVLALIESTARELGRAVRVSDVLQHAAAHQPETSQLTGTQLVTAITQFLKSGEVVIAKTIRGRKAGRHLYLPVTFDAKTFTTHDSLNWLETVAAAFDEIWSERLHEAEVKGRKPRPVTTKELRARLVSTHGDEPKLKATNSIINALWELSKHSQPLIRRISRRRRKSLLWLPANVQDEELDLENSYASDGERVGEACLRTVARYNRPVALYELAAEVEADPVLQLKSETSLSKAVTRCIDYLDDAGERNGGGYAKGYIQSVGLVNNKAYYYHCGDGAASARAYVSLRRIEAAWNELHAAKHLDGVNACLLPTVAVGRVMLIAVNAESVTREIEHLLSENLLTDEWRREAESVYARVNEIIEDAREWLSSRTVIRRRFALPCEVNTSISAITKEELLRLYKPFYPCAQRAGKAYQITTVLGSRIRRVWLPQGDAQSQRPYDRTDALLYAGRHWGSDECRIQADAATFELGYLRDARFVLPGLTDDDFNMRMAAVACLAFLPSSETVDDLRRVADGDADRGVRQAAEWACRFASDDFIGFDE